MFNSSIKEFKIKVRSVDSKVQNKPIIKVEKGNTADFHRFFNKTIKGVKLVW